MKRAMVISGGGNRFFYVVGFFKYLIEKGVYGDLLKSYSYFAGTSAGALLSVFLNLYRTKGIVPFNTVYSLRDKDIYSFNPYKNVKIWQGEDHVYHTSYDIRLMAILRLLLGKQNALGETQSLYDLLSALFGYEDYLAFLNSDIDISVTMTDYDSGEMVVRSLRDKGNIQNPSPFQNMKEYDKEDYYRFLDSVYASTCALPIIKGHTIEGRYYVDGGFTNTVPIVPLLKRHKDVEVVDVLLLNAPIQRNNYPKGNILNSISRLFNILLYNNMVDELELSMALSKLQEEESHHPITINIFHMYSDSLSDVDPFLFDAEVRDELLLQGYTSARLRGMEFYNTVCDKGEGSNRKLNVKLSAKLVAKLKAKQSLSYRKADSSLTMYHYPLDYHLS